MSRTSVLCALIHLLIWTQCDARKEKSRIRRDLTTSGITRHIRSLDFPEASGMGVSIHSVFRTRKQNIPHFRQISNANGISMDFPLWPFDKFNLLRFFFFFIDLFCASHTRWRARQVCGVIYILRGELRLVAYHKHHYRWWSCQSDQFGKHQEEQEEHW